MNRRRLLRRRRTRRSGRRISVASRLAAGFLRAAARFFWWVPVALFLWPAPPYLVDLASHFLPHAIALGLLATAAAAAASRRRALKIEGMVASTIGIGICAWSWLAATPFEAGEGQALRVATYNAKGEASRSDAEMERWLLEQDADIICMIDPPWAYPAGSEAIGDRYPHRVDPRAGQNWAITILSKHPLQEEPLGSHEDHKFSFVARRTVRVTLPSGREFLFTAMHPPSPRTQSAWRQNLEEMRRDASLLARGTKETELPCVVAGDFNTTPLGRSYHSFRRISGMRSWGDLFGRGTWPANLPSAVSLPLDRVWVSEGVAIERVRIGPSLSSDHRPVSVDLRFVEVESGQ